MFHGQSNEANDREKLLSLLGCVSKERGTQDWKKKFMWHCDVCPSLHTPSDIDLIYIVKFKINFVFVSLDLFIKNITNCI